MDEFIYARSGAEFFSVEGVTIPYKPEIQVINNIFRGSNPIEQYSSKFPFDGYLGLWSEFVNDRSFGDFLF